MDYDYYRVHTFFSEQSSLSLSSSCPQNNSFSAADLRQKVIVVKLNLNPTWRQDCDPQRRNSTNFRLNAERLLNRLAIWPHFLRLLSKVAYCYLVVHRCFVWFSHQKNSHFLPTITLRYGVPARSGSALIVLANCSRTMTSRIRGGCC